VLFLPKDLPVRAIRNSSSRDRTDRGAGAAAAAGACVCSPRSATCRGL
jgi:hypothetical protein